jgi:hypothetical protein
MAATYWIKLYHEILHDPKMGRLPDRLWRRVIEIFLMAGEMSAAGWLPSVEDMAWTLRTNEAELLQDLEALALPGIEITQLVDGRWLVPKFAARQGPVDGAERVQRYRERKRKEEYYGNEPATAEKQECNDAVTKRYTDTDTDIDTESDKTHGASAEKEEPKAKETTKAEDSLCSLSKTPSRRILLAKFNAKVAAPNGRSGPKKFETLSVAENFDKAAARLNGNLGPAIDAALTAGINSVTRIVNYIAQYEPGRKGGSNAHNSTQRPVDNRLDAVSQKLSDALAARARPDAPRADANLPALPSANTT